MAAPKKNWDYYKSEITRILGTDKWVIKDGKGKQANMSELKPAMQWHDIINQYSFRLVVTKKSAYRNEEFESDYAVWTFNLMPSQCGMLICSATQVCNSRKSGLGTLLNMMRQDIAHNHGYTTMICTNQVDNSAINQKLLAKLGWKNVFEFVNERTKNRISVNIVHLRDGEPIQLIGKKESSIPKQMMEEEGMSEQAPENYLVPEGYAEQGEGLVRNVKIR